MNYYKIIITPRALENIGDLVGYIAVQLNNPIAAEQLLNKIKTKIYALNLFPGIYPLFHDEEYNGMGIRRIISDSFFVYYKIDEETKTVYILMVVYSKRDQFLQLRKKIK